MGGRNRQPNVRYVSDLAAAGYSIPENVGPLYDEVRTYLDGKPMKFRLFDEHIEAHFKGGIKEYADRIEITFNPLSRRGAYTFAHELGHALRCQEPNGIYIDPARAGSADEENRKIVGLVASIVDHPTVHKLIEAHGFDTTPECMERTAEANRALTERNAKLIDEERAKGSATARRIALDSAQMLTTYCCGQTAEFEDRMRRFFSAEIVADTDNVVSLINQRTNGELTAHGAAVEILRVVGHGDLADYYVDRDAFDSRLQPWRPA